MSTEQITHTIQELMPLLLPLLPYLTKGIKLFGSEFMKTAGKETGEEIPNLIKAIWDKLHPKITESPVAESALKKVVESPQDQRAIGAFELVLEDLLKDKNLLGELVALLHEATEKGITVEQVTHLGIVYGQMVSVDVEDAGDLHNANIKSELRAKEIKKDGKVTGVRLGRKSR